jgi:hypothetical protein
MWNYISLLIAEILLLRRLRNAVLLKLGSALLIASLGGSLAGCSTLTQGSAQTIAINTYPPGCDCTLTRDGAIIGEINPTPATVSVFKDNKPIYIRCRKKGFRENSGQLSSGFEAMTVGNVIFGGLIGVFVDMGSGATHHYPTTASVIMIPEEFDSQAARDLYFDDMRSHFLAEAEEVIQRIKATCEESDCDQRVKAAERSRDGMLEQIENARRRAIN